MKEYAGPNTLLDLSKIIRKELKQTGGGGVPKGSIVIWSGSETDIRDGWALCDGQEGRPDLRDKFVLGAGTAHPVGETGGSEEVALTRDQMPAHDHLYNTSKNRNTIKWTSSGSSQTQQVWNGDPYTNSRTENVGGSAPHPNMPPYYALCYIIKLDEGGGGGPDGNPVGTVISFLGQTAPEGYLVCDGAEYEITAYPALADFFLQQFGSKNHFGGDGTATFAVPDMRNLFLRGYHGAAEEQLSGEVGARQEATKHPGISTARSSVSSNGIVINPSIVEGTASGPAHADTGAVANLTAAVFTGTSHMNKPTDGRFSSYTSRPVNMAVLYCVKAV